MRRSARNGHAQPAAAPAVSGAVVSLGAPACATISHGAGRKPCVRTRRQAAAGRTKPVIPLEHMAPASSGASCVPERVPERVRARPCYSQHSDEEGDEADSASSKRRRVARDDAEPCVHDFGLASLRQVLSFDRDADLEDCLTTGYNHFGLVHNLYVKLLRDDQGAPLTHTCVIDGVKDAAIFDKLGLCTTEGYTVAIDRIVALAPKDPFSGNDQHLTHVKIFAETFMPHFSLITKGTDAPSLHYFREHQNLESFRPFHILVRISDVYKTPTTFPISRVHDQEGAGDNTTVMLRSVLAKDLYFIGAVMYFRITTIAEQDGVVADLQRAVSMLEDAAPGDAARVLADAVRSSGNLVFKDLVNTFTFQLAGELGDRGTCAERLAVLRDDLIAELKTVLTEQSRVFPHADPGSPGAASAGAAAPGAALGADTPVAVASCLASGFNLGSTLMAQAVEWLRGQGVKAIALHALSQSYTFYSKPESPTRPGGGGFKAQDLRTGAVYAFGGDGVNEDGSPVSVDEADAKTRKAILKANRHQKYLEPRPQAVFRGDSFANGYFLTKIIGQPRPE